MLWPFFNGCEQKSHAVQSFDQHPFSCTHSRKLQIHHDLVYFSVRQLATSVVLCIIIQDSWQGLLAPSCLYFCKVPAFAPFPELCGADFAASQFAHEGGEGCHAKVQWGGSGCEPCVATLIWLVGFAHKNCPGVTEWLYKFVFALLYFFSGFRMWFWLSVLAELPGHTERYVRIFTCVHITKITVAVMIWL